MSVILRRTQKLANSLPVTTDAGAQSNTALGDWYVNRIVVDRRPLLLLVASRTLLAILTPGREVASLPQRLADLVRHRLLRAGIERRWVDAEVLAMKPVLVAKTADRSVLGVMVDFAGAVPYHLPVGAWDETSLPLVEAELAETPCLSSRTSAQTLWPGTSTAEALALRWGGAVPR